MGFALKNPNKAIVRANLKHLRACKRVSFPCKSVVFALLIKNPFFCKCCFKIYLYNSKRLATKWHSVFCFYTTKERRHGIILRVHSSDRLWNPTFTSYSIIQYDWVSLFTILYCSGWLYLQDFVLIPHIFQRYLIIISHSTINILTFSLSIVNTGFYSTTVHTVYVGLYVGLSDTVLKQTNRHVSLYC